MYWRCLIVVSLLARLWLATADAAEPELVAVQTGELPIVLSAPHGGRQPVPHVPPREDKDAQRFVTARDENTAELTDKIAALIEKELGHKPFFVIARFERKFIDANRPAESAYESPAAKPHYDAYHAALAEACRTTLNRWKHGLLLDIHGQSTEVDKILRGTNNRRSVTQLLERLGPEALTGSHSVLGVLQRRGYTIFPANDRPDEREHPRFNGGYIVTTHGSSRAGGLDAIQLEFGSNLRRKEVLDKTARDTADAIVEFARKYLPVQ